MQIIRRFWYMPVFGILFLLAAFIRFGVVPFSAGPDVAQFRGFAEAFRLYGLDFYRYANARSSLFPFYGWAYVYPPLWLLVLALALVVVPASTANHDFVSIDWRWAEKTPIILADLTIGVFFYYMTPGPRYLKLIFASIWWFNPAVWYNSSVFGQFDAVATALLLAAIILLDKGRDRLAFVLAALAAMTKQHTFIPFAVMAAICLHGLGWKRVAGNLGILAGIAIVISLPFLVTGNFLSYFQALLLPGEAPAYQTPLMNAFNGISALLTYWHDTLGWNTLPLIVLETPAVVIAIVVVILLCYWRKVALIRGALLGMLVFTLFFYRINYQYLVVNIALALLVAALTTYLAERVLALALVIVPSGWLWLANVPNWFENERPSGAAVVPLLEKFGLTRHPFTDSAFLIFTLFLTLLAAVYVILAFTIWKEPLRAIHISNVESLSQEGGRL